MTPSELKWHREVLKRLEELPAFHSGKRSIKLPRPFHKSMRGPRYHATGEVVVSPNHRAFFFWRDGPLRTDSAFFAWLMLKLPNDELYPLIEMHYHPSHKGLHVKLPCETSTDYTSRMLPNAPELNLNLPTDTDPRQESGRLKLIDRFCEICGIQLGRGGDLWE